MSDSKTISASTNFPGLLAVLFIGLKLGHVIDWSWLWVLSPLWIPLSLAAVAFLFVFIVAVVEA